MKYSAQSDGEWLWIAEDPTSTGKDFEDSLKDLVYRVDDAIEELESVRETILNWDNPDEAKDGVKMALQL